MKNLILRILLTVSLFLPSAYADNRGGIRDIVRQKSKDSGPTSGEYYLTDAKLNTMINIVQRDICFRSDGMRRYFYINVSTKTRTYVISPSIQKIYGVCFEDINSTGTYKQLAYTTMKVLNKDYINFENLGYGEPLEWYQVFISTWSTSELRIGLNPVPSASFSFTGSHTLKIRVEASEQAMDMTSDIDIPFNSNYRMYPLHQAIVYGVLGMIRDDQTSETKYRELIEIMKSNFMEAPAREGGITPQRR